MSGVEGVNLLGWRDIDIEIGMLRSRVPSCPWALILVVIWASKSDITLGEMCGSAVDGDRDANLYRKGVNWTRSQWELRVMKTPRVSRRYYEPKLVHVHQ